MPSVTNLSSDALNMPSVGGLTLDPGETKEVDEATAEELNGHPLLEVEFTSDPFTVAAPPAKPEPAPAPAASTEENPE